jgi:hypothetical protein
MTFQQYIRSVAKYIDYEFDSYGKNFQLNDKQQTVLNGLISYNFSNRDSINNTANDVVNFLKAFVEKNNERN